MKYRIFTSFAMEDKFLRDALIGQKRNNHSPFDFIDMSVKQPWTSSWKTNCRTKIRSCDGMIAIITSNTKNADGQLWEIKCAQEENIPILGVYGHDYDYGISLPYGYYTIKTIRWEWDKISMWLRNLQ